MALAMWAAMLAWFSKDRGFPKNLDYRYCPHYTVHAETSFREPTSRVVAKLVGSNNILGGIISKIENQKFHVDTESG